MKFLNFFMKNGVPNSTKFIDKKVQIWITIWFLKSVKQLCYMISPVSGTSVHMFSIALILMKAIY